MYKHYTYFGVEVLDSKGKLLAEFPTDTEADEYMD